MREYKFRGKDLDNNFVYGNLYQRNDDKDYCDIQYDATQGRVCITVRKDTVGLFVGSLDKNNIEIYDGDIVKDNNGTIGYINYLPQECGFVIVYKHRDRRFGHRYGDGSYSVLDIEVIGNVYDNVELLND